MNENWDQFEVNIGEILGPIERKSFTFNYIRFEVWKGGGCIYKGNSTGQIIAKVMNNEYYVTIKDTLINQHIKEQFKFGEISSNNDRIMLSKDIFNENGKTESNNPDISSLFFRQGILTKITYTIHDPNTLVEFYSY
jgi:hypothetical protein